MEEKILKKNQVSKLYNELEKEYNFYAPVKEKGNIVFKKVLNPEEIEIDFFNSRVPPKDILFPQKEVLYEYTIDEKDVTIKDRTDLDQKNIIFGIRPCDAHSFEMLENFFGFGEFKDVTWGHGASGLLFIGGRSLDIPSPSRMVEIEAARKILIEADLQNTTTV